MPGTWSQDNQLEEFVDNSENLGRRKKTKMTETPRNDNNTGEETTENEAPTPTLYLPDMKNTTLTEAKKRAIQWGPNPSEYLVECPDIEQYYRDGTLLVDFITGLCQLYMGGELENFPLQASESPFPLTLLEKILKSDAKQRISTADLPDTGLSMIITKPLEWDQMGCRTEIFADLVSMYAANQVSLQHAQLLPKDISYREISRYETKSRRIETRMDELVAVFTQDNYLREDAGLRKYPLPKINPINKEITSKAQAEKYSEEAHEEAKKLQRAAFDENREAFKATDNILESAVATMTNRPSRYTTSLPPATRREPMATATSHADRNSSPAFVLDTKRSQTPLMVRTSGDTLSGSFIVPTLATNSRSRPDTRNTVTFESKPTVNQRLMEIASSTVATTVPNREDNPNINLTTAKPTQGNDQHSHEESRNRNYHGRNIQNHSTTRTWENSYTHRTCNSCGEKGHMQRNCTKTDLYCNFCHTRTHDTVACKSKPKTSTPLESPSAGDYHPAPLPRAHNTSIPPENPNKSVIPNHVTQPSPVSSYTEDLMKAWITRLDQNQAESREKQDQKRLLKNIEVYNGSDKTQCLPWVNRIHQATSLSSMEFRKALLYKAGPTVFGIIASTPKDISELKLKQIILQNFSDIATPSEAAQKLRTMQMKTDQPIRSHNYYFTAVHKAAFGIKPEDQKMRFVFEDYANSLPEFTANKLMDKIVKSNSWIHTLQDAMEQAVKIDQEIRQTEVFRTRRNASNTTIDTTANMSVNEIDEFNVNYMAAKQGDTRFNSTMKPGHCRESKEYSPKNKYNDSHHSKPWHGGKKEGNNYNNYRRINKYRHPAREPRHNIRFEYATGRGEREIMRVLNRMIEYLKGKSDREIESIKNMPKYDQRGVHEVSEDSIATITIDEIQRTLKEDLNIVYDALVAFDYIKEITEA